MFSWILGVGGVKTTTANSDTLGPTVPLSSDTQQQSLHPQTMGCHISSSSTSPSDELIDSSTETASISNNNSCSSSMMRGQQRAVNEDWEWVEEDDGMMAGLMRVLSDVDDNDVMSDVCSSDASSAVQVALNGESPLMSPIMTATSSAAAHASSLSSSGCGANSSSSTSRRRVKLTAAAAAARAATAADSRRSSNSSNSSSSLNHKQPQVALHPALAALRERELKMRKLGKLNRRGGGGGGKTTFVF